MTNELLTTTSNSSKAHAPTVGCQICRDDVALVDTVALRACGHRFCATCMSQYLEVKIREGDVELTCFHHDEGSNTQSVCGKLIVDEDIQHLAPVTYTTFTRFLLIKSTSQARQCPFCDHVQVPGATVEEPSCTCERCGRQFCFTHGNAHAEKESCAQYEKRQSRAEQRSRRAVSRISRPCPTCTRPIEKNGGCSHMTCRVCKTQFCWRCGMKWGFDPTAHGRLLDLGSCDGIAESKLFFMRSSNTTVRFLGKAMYYLIMATVGWPLTIALCWGWVPYTLWAEHRAIARRARVLARVIAIVVTLMLLFIGPMLILLVADSLAWLRDVASKGLRKLRQFIRSNCCCRGRGGANTIVRTEISSGYTSFQDATHLV